MYITIEISRCVLCCYYLDNFKLRDLRNNETKETMSDLMVTAVLVNLTKGHKTMCLKFEKTNER